MKKIPDNAIKVFEGVVFDVYHWPQEAFDGSFLTFEAIKKKDTVAVIAVCDGKIILNKEEQPVIGTFVCIPSGMSEQGSGMIDNAERELLEETGMVSDDWQELFVSEPIDHPKIDWKNYFYIARNCKKIAEQKLDPGENIQVTFVTFEEFLETRNNPKFRNKDLIPFLEKAASNEEEKQKLKELLGVIT